MWAEIVLKRKHMKQIKNFIATACFCSITVIGISQRETIVFEDGTKVELEQKSVDPSDGPELMISFFPTSFLQGPVMSFVQASIYKPKNFIARNLIKQTQTTKGIKEGEELKLPELNVDINLREINEVRRSRTLMVGGGKAGSPSELSAGHSKSKSPSHEGATSEGASAAV